MRRTAITQTGTGATVPVVVNRQLSASVVGIVTGTVNYTIQVTYDDVFAQGFDASTATWFPHPTSALVSATANQQGVIDFPVVATRALVNSGDGSVSFIVLQDERAG